MPMSSAERQRRYRQRRRAKRVCGHDLRESLVTMYRQWEADGIDTGYTSAKEAATAQFAVLVDNLSSLVESWIAGIGLYDHDETDRKRQEALAAGNHALAADFVLTTAEEAVITQARALKLPRPQRLNP